MVGAVTLTSVCAPENFDNSLPAFATLNSGPGWVSGHPVSFKCWDASTGIESSIFNVAYSNPYADPYCFTENIFPPADGYYSLPVIDFTGQGYQPTFNVYHSDGAVVATGVASTSYTETGLTNGTEYCYYVTQVLDDGTESPASNTLCATPQLPVIPVTGILVLPDTLNLNSGETGQMTAYIDPPNATNPSVTWSSANTDIATVDATGLVSAIAQGEVYIKATANDGGLADSSLVIVHQVNIAPTLVSAIPGCEKITLTWTPANVTKKDSRLVHFNFQGGDPSDYVYTFYLFGAQLNGINLEAGDEIAVFDGNKMVGAKALTSVCSPDNYNNFIPAFKTLTSESGYTPGNPVSFRCWDASEGIESSIFQVNYTDNGDPYCFTQNVFPSGDGYYCLSDVSFTGTSYNPVYNLYYSNGNLVIGGLTNTTFVNEGLVTGTEYCYYVTQILPDGSESVASNILCATPGIDLPGTAGTITGTSVVCQGQTNVQYSVAEIEKAEGYDWILPEGASIVSGGYTNMILVNYSNSAVSGNITVSGTNGCGNGPESPAFAVTVNPLPGTPGTITGQANVCLGQTGVVYTVPPIANATGYIWSVPAGVTIVSGSNTNSITVDITQSAVSGNITVYGTNTCGNGVLSQAFALTVSTVPGAAGNITGPSTVNQGQTGVVYSVAAIANATGYVWTVPTGATIVSGANTNSITVDFSNTAFSGNFTVYGTNDCGNGAVSSPYAVTVNPLNNPTVTIGTLTNVVAGAFALPVNAANVNNMGAFQFTIEFDPALMEYVGTSNWYPGIDAITVGYPSPGHITFVWAAELQGITILNNEFFDINFTWLGSNSTSPVIWSDNPTPREFSDWDGNIFVPTYVNGSVTGINGGQLSVTPDNQNVTSPSGSTSFAVANVGTGTMTYTSDITTGGDWLTITSGGSGGNTGTIVVAYTQNTSSASRVGTITVTAPGAIGSPKQVTVTQEGCMLPGAAGTITGPATVCQGQNGVVYSVATIANAIGYVWTVPSGATIVSGNNTNSITVNFSSTATSGSFTVYGTNDCGNGTISPPYAVTVNPLPGAAGTITGLATVCQGQNGVVYSVATIANATSYVWTVPSGTTIVSGNNTNSITVNFSSTAASGNFTVYGTNGCGNGTVSPPYVVVVNPLPGAAGNITGPATVCQGQNGVVYSVATIANATGYVWTVPSGATIASGNNTNSITVNFSDTATSGSFTVYGTNGCGNGTVSPPYTVTVDLLPDTAGTPTGPDSVCYNHTPTSDYTTSGATNATSYLWSISPAAAGIITGTGLTSTVTWNEWTGNASITVTGVNDCGEGPVSAPMVVNVDLCPGIPEQIINKLQVNVFPNPSDGRFNIELTSDKNITFNLSVHNMIGETVLVERNIRFAGYYLKTMDLNNLNNGVYFVYLESNEGLIIKKITIQH